MTIDIGHAISIALGVIIPFFGWFLKRELGRIEKSIESNSSHLEKHSEAITSIASQITRVVEIGKWEPNLQRFFGDGGGNQRIWKAIEAIQADIEQCRERDHFIVNKLSIIKAMIDKEGKLKTQEWDLPQWKAKDKKEA